MIIEPGERNYSAYLPDLPGCVATGKTIEEVDNACAKRLNSISKECVKMDCPSRNPQVSLITSKPHERTMLILSTLLDDSDLRASALICG